VKRLKTYIAFSLVLHVLAVFAIYKLGEYAIHKIVAGGGRGGAGGAVVTVWIDGQRGTPADAAAEALARRSDISYKAKAPTSPQAQNLGDARGAGNGAGTGGGDAGGMGGEAGSGAGASAGDDETLAKIWRKIDGRKYYPQIARQKGIEGSPKITFEVKDGGGIAWVRLSESCGSKVLDDAAIETVKGATPLPYYPKPITLALKYSMSE
jgi:TonB family protein